MSSNVIFTNTMAKIAIPIGGREHERQVVCWISWVFKEPTCWWLAEHQGSSYATKVKWCDNQLRWAAVQVCQLISFTQHRLSIRAKIACSSPV